MITLPIFTFILFIAAIFGLSWTFHSYLDQKSKACLTEDCLRSATLIVEAMNKSVDPCDDFYQFACGRFGNMHRIPLPLTSTNRFYELNDIMIINIKEFLEKKDMNESSAVQKSRKFYRSCMAIDKIENVGVKPLLTILEKIGLPVSELKIQNTDKENQKTFSSILAKTKKYIDLNYLFELQIISDINNDKINLITLLPSSGYELLPQSRTIKNIEKIQKILTVTNTSETDDEKDFDILKLFEKYFKKLLTEIYSQPYDLIFNKNVILSDIIKFFMDLRKILKPNEDASISFMTLDELQSFTDNITLNKYSPCELTIDWKEYLTILYKDVPNVTLDFETDIIQVYNLQYFTKLFELLRETKRNVGMGNLWWYIVTSLGKYTTDDMRFFQNSFKYQLYGYDFNTIRSSYCTNTVSYMMLTAVSSLLPKMKSINHNKQMIIELVKNIQWAFANSVDDLMWMDDDTKNMTLFKAQRMKTLIGYPEISQSTNALDDYYSDLEVKEDDFFGNVLRIKQSDVNQNLMLLRKNNSAGETWHVDPLSVNAYYEVTSNTIIIPGGILQLPFFGHDVQVLNYGLFGSVLGHELTHGFDNTGRNYDHNGNPKNWWSNQTTREFEKRAECFVRHYGSYKAPLNGQKLDGNLTLNENIADNGGLREAFWAYRKFVNDHGEEPKLPGLENFSNEQIFFLSFANLWCETNEKKTTWEFVENEHSPNYVRVVESLINSEEFAEVWKCKNGTRMNPLEKKCKIW